jgi:hypothetical protein
MEIPYKIEDYEYLVTQLKDDLNKNPRRIFYLNGIAGSGKSYVVDKLVNHIEESKFCDVLFKIDSGQGLDFLSEFFTRLCSTFVDYQQERVLRTRETQANYSWLFKVLELCKEQAGQNQEYFNSLVGEIRLKSKYQNLNKERKEYPFEYEKPKDKDILFNQADFCTESFLVDMMTNFYPINKTTTLEDYVNNPKPIKVIIILEDYYEISSSLNEFLIHTFFRTLYFKSYNDFKFYKPGKNNYNLAISNFFDFRFVISGREIIAEHHLNRIKNEYSTFFHEILFSGLSKDELEEYLLMQNLEPEYFLDDFEEISQGNVLMVNQLVRSVLSSKSTIDILSVYEAYENRLLNIYNEKEQSWIKAASFLEFIKPTTLRPFSEIAEDYQLAYDFIEKSTELHDYEEKIKNEKLVLNKIVRDCLKDRFNVDFPQKAETYTKVATAISNMERPLQEMNNEEFEILRNLAYYNRFEPNFVQEEVFKELNVDIIELCAKHKYCFYTTKFTKSVRYEIAESLEVYNRNVDIDTFFEKRREVQSIWDDYQIYLDRQNQEKMVERGNLEEEKDRKDDEKFEIEKELNLQNQKILKIKAKEAALRKRLKPYKYEIKKIPFIITSVLTVISFVVIGNINFLLGLVTEDPLIKGLSTYSIILLSVGLLISVLVPIFKFVRIKIKQTDIEKLEEQVEAIVEVIAENVNTKLSIERKLTAVNQDLEEIKSQLDELNKFIDHNNAKLKEPFFQKDE